MKRHRLKRIYGVGAALTLASLLAACGSSSSSSSSAAAGSASTASAASSTTAAGSGPGAGKPAVTIGDKNFTEEYILGALYQQALQAKGFNVTLKGNIGSSELIYKSLTSGQIDLYPEYTGTLLTAIANVTAPPRSAIEAYDEAKAYLLKHGYTLLNQTPFADSDAIGTTKSYATAHHLASIADLKPLGTGVKLGGLPEFQTRAQGLIGLRKDYGINPTFVPLASGLFYNALDNGQVQVSDVFTTDPQLSTGKYVVLADPKHEFGFQNVAPVVKQSVVTAEGPAFTQTLNAVDAALTTKAIIAMNAAVALDKQTPTSVAHAFLKANGLL
jgi:osmoprotectant transport system substrate-binding protein